MQTNRHSSIPPLLWEPREAARALSISERKLWSLTAPRGPLPCVKLGRLVRYSPGDLQRWIDQQKAGS